MSDFLEKAEEEEIFRQKHQGANHSLIFATKGSSGHNPEKLAQICFVWDFNMKLMGWEDKPIGHLASFLTQYQASIDGKYHKDYRDVLIAEEIERRRQERKGISILQQ